ncbi:MAG: hypothetical protein EON58_01115 [Alphaproteobacteria bacterium]|nr:MAG: hypothetical protein EON58_01115 [Alphaproteobacteria bacterium]
MEFNFEALEDRRFQRLCQSLLTSEFPDLQCFPLGQADGGRDATSGRFGNGVLVFQIKFTASSPKKSRSQWIKEVVNGERDKVIELANRGAQRYILITNIPGTGSLDSGSIDAADTALDELPIPAEVWWRDDILRRLDRHPELKWRFIEGAGGTDILTYLLNNVLTEDADRRKNAVRAFLTDQLSHDAQIRFRQISFNNDLLSLFVDPALSRSDAPDSYLRDASYRDSRLTIRAAAFFLSLEEGNILLEGGPGQGKSTITQFVCQMYRLHLLGDADSKHDAITKYESVAVKLPLRVDLRDYAAWLEGLNPFDQTQNKAQKSLEAFLAALISFHAGGVDFSVADLHATFKATPVFLALDGLDEVGEQERRQEVVNQVTRGVSRLRANAMSLTVLVTSRPTAHTQSASFSERSYLRLKVLPLSKEQATEFGKKWIAVNNIPRQEAKDVLNLLTHKMSLPHLQQLSRNPMQLTILLNLVRAQGSSLPDQRTNLYADYLKIFLDRESEKNDQIRDNRNLFESLHEYVALRIHIEAEIGIHDGRVPLDAFKATVADYLKHECRPDFSFGELERGVFERLGFLVSRTEGLVEFEVQPLREFLAAKHLYRNAAFSNIGSVKAGTISDRFDAIAGNPYWLNVTRFFAGFFERGQLPLILERLRELDDSPLYSNTTYTRGLCSCLARDYVFSHGQRTFTDAVKYVLEQFDTLARYSLATVDVSRMFDEPLDLPKTFPESPIVDAALAASKNSNISLDRLSNVIFLNGDLTLLLNKWRKGWKHFECAPSDWLELGYWLGFLDDSKDLGTGILIPKETPLESYRLLTTKSLLEKSIQNTALSSKIYKSYFNDPDGFAGSHSALSIIDRALKVAPDYMIESFYRDNHKNPQSFILSEPFPSSTSDLSFLTDEWAGVSSFLSYLKDRLADESLEWFQNVQLCREFLTCAEDSLGVNAMVTLSAVHASPLLSKGGRTRLDVNNWHDLKIWEKSALLYTCRNRKQTWGQILSEGHDHDSLFLVLSMVLLFGSGDVVREHAERLDDLITTLPEVWLSRLTRGIRRSYRTQTWNAQIGSIEHISNLPNLFGLIYSISGERKAHRMANLDVFDEVRLLPWVAAAVVVKSTSLLLNDEKHVPKALDIIARTFARAGDRRVSRLRGMYFSRQAEWLSDSEVTTILDNPNSFPSELALLADTAAFGRLPLRIPPVSSTAEEQGWLTNKV